MSTELVQFVVVKRGNRIADNNENGKCLWGHTRKEGIFALLHEEILILNRGNGKVYLKDKRR